MSRITLFSCLMLVLCLHLESFGQIKIDQIAEKVQDIPQEVSHIRIKLDSSQSLVFRVDEELSQGSVYRQVRKSDNLGELLNSFAQAIQVLADSQQNDQSYAIMYTYRGEGAKNNLSLKLLDPEVKHYINENGTLKPFKPQSDYILLIDPIKSYHCYLILDRLSEAQNMVNLPLESIRENIEKDFQSLPKYYQKGDIALDYQVGENTFTRESDETRGVDYIEISGRLGINLIRDRFVPEVGLDIRANFKERFYIGATADVQHIFQKRESGGFQTLRNLFVGGEFGWNLSRVRKKANYFGVGLEYLVYEEGDFYNPNTLKINLNWDKKKSGIRISPQAYYDFDSKDFFWGFQLGKVF